MKGGFVRGPLRDTFLRVAAALLSVPERYQNTLTRLGQDINSERKINAVYSEKQFGDVNHLGIDEVATFLTAAGVPASEAKQ
jgi:hypothetical protein